MQGSKIAYRRKAIPEGQGAGRAAGQLDFAANSECGVSKLIRSGSHLIMNYEMTSINHPLRRRLFVEHSHIAKNIAKKS